MEILVEFRSKRAGEPAGRRAGVESQQFCFGQGGRERPAPSRVPTYGFRTRIGYGKIPPSGLR
jgi:hypothetical protein